MPTTPVFAFPYQSLGDAPDGPNLGEDLALAVEAVLNGELPGKQLALTTRTASSSTFTAETVLDTVTAPTITGHMYKLTWTGLLSSSGAPERVTLRIREDNIAGTVVQAQSIVLTIANNSEGHTVEGFFTAVATGGKTFVATGQRTTAVGNVTAAAGATTPTYLYVLVT